MSYVMNALLAFSVMEREGERIAEVNGHLSANDQRRQMFGDIGGGDAYGGTKCMEVPLWGGAFNHLAPEAMMAAVRSASWKYPELVQVFICDQDDDNFTLHTIA